MTTPDREPRQPTGLSPVSIALGLGGAAVVWLVVDVLRRVL